MGIMVNIAENLLTTGGPRMPLNGTNWKENGHSIDLQGKATRTWRKWGAWGETDGSGQKNLK